GCSRSQTITWNVSDACGNPALTVSRTVTWTEDKTAPVIVAGGTTLSLGCNPNAADIEAALGSATYTDNCGPLTPTTLAGVDGSVADNACSRSQTRTWNVSRSEERRVGKECRSRRWTEDYETKTFNGWPDEEIGWGENPN